MMMIMMMVIINRCFIQYHEIFRRCLFRVTGIGVKLQDGFLLSLLYKRTDERHSVNQESLKHSDSYVKICWRNSKGRMVNTERVRVQCLKLFHKRSNLNSLSSLFLILPDGFICKYYAQIIWNPPKTHDAIIGLAIFNGPKI